MPRSRVPMPARVYVAVVLLVILIGATAYWFSILPLEGAYPLLLPAIIQLVFLVLLVRGHPLARQWVRYLGVVFALAAVVFGLAMFLVRPPIGRELLLCVGCAVASRAMFLGVAGSEARRFFDLYCGYCRTEKVRARSFFYNRIGCLRCGQEWRPHGARIDAAVFD